MKNSVLLLSIFLFSSCAGYRFKNRLNPFQAYGIKSVSVPMFSNKSLLSNVAPKMTSEIIRLLNDYKGLRVTSGDSSSSDAVLLGIISGDSRWKNFLQTELTRFTDGDLKQSIGNRNSFNLPINSSMKLKLRLILIKNPRKFDLELARSELAEKITTNDRYIFIEDIELQESIQRVLKPSHDGSGAVNFTKNAHILQLASEAFALQASKKVQQEIFNAF